MPLVSEWEVLRAALRGGYAVGAFNANSLEMVQGIVWAAEQTHSPVIVQASPGAIKYAGLGMIRAMVGAAAEEATVPVVLHLDHGMTLKINQQCAAAGFGGIMFDGSELDMQRTATAARVAISEMPLEILVDCVQGEQALRLNIEATREVVVMAKQYGIPVEGELGHIPRIERLLTEEEIAQIRSVPEAVAVEFIRSRCGEQVEALMAQPEQADRFVKETGCFSLAAAIGSIHGMPADIWPINVARLRAIRECLPETPIVSHGSSGILRTRADAKKWSIQLREGEGTLEEAVRLGLAKVNVATAISMAFLRDFDQHRAAHPDERDFRKPGGQARDAVQELVAGYMELLGSAGKA